MTNRDIRLNARRVLCAVLALIICMSGAQAENTAPDKPAAPVFSVPGGFYDDVVLLEMISLEGNTVYYTTDCNSPANIAYSYRYAGPVEIRNTDNTRNTISSRQDVSLEWYASPDYPVPKATVVRAVCVDENGSVSDETVQTYFVGRTESYYTAMNTISLVADSSDLFGTVSGIYVVGDMYTAWCESDDYQPYDSLSDPRNPANYNQRGREWERPCRIQVFSGGKSILEQAVGVRVAGNYSRSSAQKSLTFYARKDYGKGKMKCDLFSGRCLDMNGEPITAFDRFTLRNGGNDYSGARFRDDLNQELMSGLHLSVQTKAPYILYINGEFWGLYSMQEKLDDHYLASHYGVDKNNVTIMKRSSLDKGSEEIAQEYRDFYAWALEADFSEEENYRHFADTVDVDGLIDLFAAQSYICNWDFAPNINNWMIWRVNVPDGTPYGDGKWRFMVYDTEYSLGLYGQSQTQYDFDYLNQMDTDNTDLALPVLVFYLTLLNEDFNARFRERYEELIDTVFDPENVMPLIDRLVGEQQEAFMDTAKRFNLWHSYVSDVFEIRYFFENRAPYALESLESFCSD